MLQKVMAHPHSGGRPPRSYDHLHILVEKIHLSDGDDAREEDEDDVASDVEQQEIDGSDVMAVDKESGSSLEVVSKPGKSLDKTLEQLKADLFGTPAQPDESIVSTSAGDPETMLVLDAESTPHVDPSNDFDALLEDAESAPHVDPKAYTRYKKNEQKAKKVKKEKSSVLKKPSRLNVSVSLDDDPTVDAICKRHLDSSDDRITVANRCHSKFWSDERKRCLQMRMSDLNARARTTAYAARCMDTFYSLRDA